LKQLTAKQLAKNLGAFSKLARFDTPFICGDRFTLADCAAIVHLPLVSNATKVLYGQDLLAEHVPAARDYLKRMGQRPHVLAVNEGRKRNTEQMLQRVAH
ncbi:MAG: glutathione S-transferase, partial [Comamonadaceae bacterium]